LSTITTIYLKWVYLLTLEETGGSPVLNYRVSINVGLTIN